MILFGEATLRQDAEIGTAVKLASDAVKGRGFANLAVDQPLTDDHTVLVAVSEDGAAIDHPLNRAVDPALPIKVCHLEARLFRAGVFKFNLDASRKVAARYAVRTDFGDIASTQRQCPKPASPAGAKTRHHEGQYDERKEPQHNL